MDMKPVALQLWTVRHEIARDLVGTLQRVAEIGYTGVELTSHAEFPPPRQLRSILQQFNLQVVGAHVPFIELRDSFRAVADYQSEVGNRNLMIPIIPRKLRPTEEDWKQRVREIANIGRECQSAGFRLFYHNHAVEFESKVERMDAHDYIFSTIDACVLGAELDTYFIKEVGKDPAEYIRRYAGRVPLLHIKDLAETKEGPVNAEIGHGIINWDAVFSASDDAGVEWYIVEQDCKVHPELESVKMSHDYLLSRGIV